MITLILGLFISTDPPSYLFVYFAVGLRKVKILPHTVVVNAAGTGAREIMNLIQVHMLHYSLSDKFRLTDLMIGTRRDGEELPHLPQEALRICLLV